jgi:phosphohistidine phosphatase
MKILLIRHAAAVPRGTPGIADDDRSLTPRGRAKFRAAARGLAEIVDRPDALLTSPLPRARATADIAAAAFRKITPRVEPDLGRSSVEAIVAVLAKYPSDALVAIVGHEPTLSSLLARFLGGGHAADRFVFKKGGAALVSMPDGPSAPGRLHWFVKPRILRALAGRRGD